MTDPELIEKQGTTWSKLGVAQLGQRKFSEAAMSFGKATAGRHLSASPPLCLSAEDTSLQGQGKPPAASV